MTTLYGLIGFPLGHSFSARYFAEKFERENLAGYEYRNFPLEEIGELRTMLAAHPELRGFNVTIPYKQQIIPLLAGLSDEARTIGAVNCVRISPQGLFGYNTDAFGFRRSLLGLIGEERPQALVLGTGGASRAVRYVLEQLGISYRLVSRSAATDRIGYNDLTSEIMRTHRLIVNATPLGTYPDVANCPPLPYAQITPGHFLFDLVYNPPLTEFMRRGEAQGAAVCNGYEMLVGQAEKAWEIWQQTL